MYQPIPVAMSRSTADVVSSFEVESGMLPALSVHSTIELCDVEPFRHPAACFQKDRIILYTTSFGRPSRSRQGACSLSDHLPRTPRGRLATAWYMSSYGN